MVLTVIAVYVICWLPYWLFQIIMLYASSMPAWLMPFYQLITILSYANSAVNPILYAFLSDNFRRTFARAFGCATAAEVDRALKRTGHQQSEAMPDDGAQPPKTTAIRLESFRDNAGPQCSAEQQNLIVADGRGQEAGNCVTTTSCHAVEIEVLRPQEDNKLSC